MLKSNIKQDIRVYKIKGFTRFKGVSFTLFMSLNIMLVNKLNQSKDKQQKGSKFIGVSFILL